MRIQKQSACWLINLLIISGLGLSACRSSKNIAYFRDIPDSTAYSQILKAKYTEPTIIPDDILDIRVQTVDPQAALALNEAATNNNVVAPTNLQQVTGFVVDKEGEVELPVLGRIALNGLTTFEAKNKIRELAKKYFKDPTVQVRFVNFKVTVIGEVARPSSYTMPNERVSILDAIGLAGDLTIYGKRENVLLIRETEDGKEMIRFNLNDSQLFASPYYYLKQNDVVYVEPRPSRIAAADNAQLTRITVGASLLSTLAILLNIIL